MTDQEIIDVAKVLVEDGINVNPQYAFCLGTKWHRDNDQTMKKVRELRDKHEIINNTPATLSSLERNLRSEFIKDLTQIIR